MIGSNLDVLLMKTSDLRILTYCYGLYSIEIMTLIFIICVLLVDARSTTYDYALVTIGGLISSVLIISTGFPSLINVLSILYLESNTLLLTNKNNRVLV